MDDGRCGGGGVFGGICLDGWVGYLCREYVGRMSGGGWMRGKEGRKERFLLSAPFFPRDAIDRLID